MRNFDQRMDEIRRRSEELKLKQRKRRKLALTVIPLALCLVLCLGVLLPEVYPSLEDGVSIEANGGMPGRGESSGAMNPEQSAGTALSVERIEITGKGLDRTVSDPAVIAQICALWDKGTASTPNFSISGAPLGGAGQDPTGVHDGYSVDIYNGKSSPKDCYIVAFTDIDGSVRKYKLNESVLTELSTGETDFLSEDELTKLYGLLGLPQE